MPVLVFRLATPSLLVDLRRLPGLGNIVVGDDGVRLRRPQHKTGQPDGRLSRHRQVGGTYWIVLVQAVHLDG
jgi:hypothetical protein